MKNGKVSSGRVLIALLLLAGLAGCSLPDQPAEAPPADALSYDQLLANLDALQGPAAKDLGAGGLTLSAQDLSTYLNAIKTEIAAFVYSRAGGRPYLVTARRLSWTNSDGGPESGLMWVPVAWGLKASIICYQHGTQVYQECAPSRYNPNPLAVLSSKDLTGALQSYVECTVGALMASAGYIVVMPDYVGFGDSSLLNGPDHPYVTMKLGDSVKGALQRAKESFWWWSAVKPNGKVFLTGYSEGGYATMAGARALQGTGALPAGFVVKGIVPCDGAYDLSGTMLEQMLSEDPIPIPSYLLYAASGFHAIDPQKIVYGELLVDPYAGSAATLFNGEHTNAEVGAAAPSDVAPYDMLQEAARTALKKQTGDVYKLLVDNNAWVGWKPSAAPVIFVHCRADDVVPIENAEAAMTALGSLAYTRLVEVPSIPLIKTIMGTEHVAAYPAAMLAAFIAIDGLNR